MRPPIIAVDSSGDVLIFDSVQSAERYLEPIDVLHGEYVIYDARGCELTASLAPRGRGITIAEREPARRRQPELRQHLIAFLAAAGEDEDSLEGLSLEELVALGQRKYPTR